MNFGQMAGYRPQTPNHNNPRLKNEGPISHEKNNGLT